MGDEIILNIMDHESFLQHQEHVEKKEWKKIH